MKRRIPLYLLLTSVQMVLCVSIARSQQFRGTDSANHPYWIAMMRNTNTNYFEAVRAFNTYWKNREKPRSEDEKFERAAKGANNVSKNIPYSFEYRKFVRWQTEMKPYVMEDGRILYPYQRHQLRLNARRANPSNSKK